MSKKEKVKTVKTEESKLETPIEETPNLVDEIVEPTEAQLLQDQTDLRLKNEEKQRKIEAGHLVAEEEDSDEIKFLITIYNIQNNGGYGKHLNELIKNKVAELKEK